MAETLCLNCETASPTRPRGLCWKCFSRSEVRKWYEADDHYRPRDDLSWADELSPVLAPCRPTNAIPGTEEKVRVLARRFASRQKLHHADDASLDDRECTALAEPEELLFDAV